MYGETDDFSYNIVKDPVHIHDFHATVLRLLGYDHERFVFKYQARLCISSADVLISERKKKCLFLQNPTHREALNGRNRPASS